MIYLKALLLALVALLTFNGIGLWGVLNGWWSSPIAAPGDPQAFMRATRELLENNPGNAALLLIEDGAVFDAHYSSNLDPVDGDTLFPVASMSKWVTAWGVMTLVEDGRLTLDTPIANYLSEWQLPAGQFDADAVTIARLLSHTAGLTDGLGFGDYQPDEPVPGTVESLHSPRASSGAPAAIAVGQAPGEFLYSGGGYLILQQIVEEQTGQAFADFMHDAVLTPLGMQRSTFRHTGGLGNVARSVDRDGAPAPAYRYAAAAATGLNTSANDMARFVLAQTGAGDAGQTLSQAAIERMREPHAYALGAAVWGLGTILYAPTAGDDFVFGHDGSNEPAINSAARLNPDSGDGIVVLVTGSDLATTLGAHWTRWQTGLPDFLVLPVLVGRALPVLAAGSLAIIALTIVAIVLQKRRARRRAAQSAAG